MKKIGVITFLTTKDNYGQVLQAFALQYVLKQLGNVPFIINYEKQPYKVWWKNIIITIIHFLFPNWRKPVKNIDLEIKNKKRNFENFIGKYINKTPEIYHTLNELKKSPPSADIYITGSDQVWAQLISDKNNRAYFLDFGPMNIKRIAYAPSFAMPTYPKELVPQLTKLLKRFDAISVREKNGIAICKNAGRNDVQVVLDPTLLLDGETYKKLFINHQNKHDPYLFIYCLNILNPEELEWESIQQYSKKNNLAIITTPSSGVYPAKELFDEVTYSYCTIEEWLNNIAFSEVTVTTSFHGIVFCILLNKKFIYVPLKNKFKRANDRVTDLLEMLKLHDRIITDKLSFNKIIDTPIDWLEVNRILSQKRLDSLSFLNNALQSPNLKK